jgi:hypothetical protein
MPVLQSAQLIGPLDNSTCRLFSVGTQLASYSAGGVDTFITRRSISYYVCGILRGHNHFRKQEKASPGVC